MACLYCTALHCTVLYCTVPLSSSHPLRHQDSVRNLLCYLLSPFLASLLTALALDVALSITLFSLHPLLLFSNLFPTLFPLYLAVIKLAVRFFEGHTDDVTCLTLSTDRNLAASGMFVPVTFCFPCDCADKLQ